MADNKVTGINIQKIIEALGSQRLGGNAQMKQGAQRECSSYVQGIEDDRQARMDKLPSRYNLADLGVQVDGIPLLDRKESCQVLRDVAKALQIPGRVDGMKTSLIPMVKEDNANSGMDDDFRGVIELEGRAGSVLLKVHYRDETGELKIGNERHVTDPERSIRRQLQDITRGSYTPADRSDIPAGKWRASFKAALQEG